MDKKTGFAERITTIQKRLAELEPVALAEQLQSALEDLRVAQEELQQQYEELLSAQTALEEAGRQRYLALFELAPCGYLVTDLMGVIREANQKAAALLRCAQENLQGKPLIGFIPKKDHKAFCTRLNKLTKTREYQDWEQRLQPAGSISYPALITVRRMHDVQGSPSALLWMIRVTSNLTQVEEILTERWQAEERLHQQQAKPAPAHRLSTVSEIIALVAHELNQPLTALLAYAQGSVLQFRAETKANPALGKMLEQMAKLAQRAADVVRSIRDFARNQDIEWQSIDINQLVHDTISLIGPEIQRSKVKIALRLSSKIPPLRGDRHNLQQLLLNLLLNGAEAMETIDAGHRCLTVSTFINVNHEFELHVADTGTGISPEVGNRLFEPLVSAKESGLGLRLSICQTIVETHRGRIWAHANPECGTTFHVTLPLESGYGHPA